MKNELVQVIQDWKNKQIFIEIKNIWKLNTSIKPNEYLLLIEIAAVLSFNGQKEIVKISKLFQTLAQNDSTIDLNTDIHRLKRLFEQIDVEFLLKTEEAMNKYINNLSTLEKEEI